MAYNPLPTNINQRAVFFRELEERYAELSATAEELLRAITAADAEEAQVRLDYPDVISQGARKPSALEYLEATFLLQAPGELNGKSSTEAQRAAWATKNLQESTEYRNFGADHRAGLSSLNDVIMHRQESQNELRLIYAYMTHLDAWISFFAAPRPVPPPPAPPQGHDGTEAAILAEQVMPAPEMAAVPHMTGTAVPVSGLENTAEEQPEPWVTRSRTRRAKAKPAAQAAESTAEEEELPF